MVWGAIPFLEPGTLRYTGDIRLEGVFQAPRPGWYVNDDGLNKTWTKIGHNERPWKTEWGSVWLNEFAAQFTPDIAARMEVEVQGDYADRYWRPINANHRADENGEHVFIREAEGHIKKESWYLEGFSSVGRPSWKGKGDLFELYPESWNMGDYLGLSSSFGMYPESWQQDTFFNISGDHVPRGGELGGTWNGMSAVVAYGSELSWRFQDSFFGRLNIPFRETTFTMMYQDEDAPYVDDPDQRDQAGAISWEIPFGGSHIFDAGVLYRPFRSGEQYTVSRRTTSGGGLLGSDYNLEQKTAQNEDGLGARARFLVHQDFFDHPVDYAVDWSYLGLLAGNKHEIKVDGGSFITQLFRADMRFTYRRPLEGPVPLLYEGTPNNMGAVVSQPRGPESPFTVGWDNREATLFLTTFQLNPSDYSTMFLWDPHRLERWNLKTKDQAEYGLAAQYKLSDYHTATDRQWYINEYGDVAWEPAASPGAPATRHPIHEYRILGTVQKGEWAGLLGFAGGEMLAPSGVPIKPITDYFSIEAEISHWPLVFRGHYGSGIWGPEPFQQFFGESFDRLFGGGDKL